MHGSPEPDLTLLIPPDVPDDVQADAGRELLYSGEVFGTTWSLTLVRKAKTEARNDRAYIAQLAKACEQTLALIDDQMSRWREGSTIARYNALPPGHSAVLPEPISIVVGKALAVCERTNGAFSPGLYEAVERWGFGAAELEDPVASGLEYARARSSLSASQSTPCPQLRDGALERPEGFALDLNGIAKGYAVDLLCDVVRSHPDTAACLVEIGGELKGYGTRADGMPF